MKARKCVGMQRERCSLFNASFCGVVALLALLFMALLDGTRSPSIAAPFAGCTGDLYMVRGPTVTTPSRFHTVDINNEFALGTGALVKNGTADITVNAIGFNKADNFIYGFQQRPTTGIVKIHSDATVELFPSNIQTVAGEVGDDGYLYYINPTEIGRVQLNTLSATNVTVERVNLPPDLQNHGILDLAFYDGHLYGVAQRGPSPGHLVSIDIANIDWGGVAPGTYEVIGEHPVYGEVEDGPDTNDYMFGAMFGGTNGIYGNLNSGGFYYFDSKTGEATHVGPSGAMSSNDGAKCYDTPILLPTDIELTKKPFPVVADDTLTPTFNPGKTTQYIITVTNNGIYGLPNIEVSDPLPDGIQTARWRCLVGGQDATNDRLCKPISGVGPLDAIVTIGLGAEAEVSYVVEIDVPSDFTSELVNTAAMTLPPTTLQDANHSATVTKLPAGLSLVKTGTYVDVDKSNEVNIGDQIHFEFLVTNVGIVPITDISIVDPMVAVTPASYPSLEPGAPALRFTATHMITQEDIDNNEIINFATATGKTPDGKETASPQESWQFTIPPAPAISTQKSGRFLDDVVENEFPDEGEHVEFTVSVKNSGNVSMVAYAPIDAGPTANGVPMTGTLTAFTPESQTVAPGEEGYFTALYRLTAKDIAEVAGVLDGIQNTVETPVQTLKEAREGKMPEPHALEEPSVMSLPGFAISKTAQVSQTTRGQQVPYVINIRPIDLTGIGTLRDQMPAGFRYLPGSASVANVAVEPKIEGRTLIFELDVPKNEDTKIEYTLVVSGTIALGTFRNTAQVFQAGQPTLPISTSVSDVVEVVPDPIFDCGDVIGSVFDDKNRNGYQDAGELGIPGARVASVQGALITTDQYGRFNVACADLPDGRIGSTYIMKLDPRSLPTGYRILSENPRTVRLTAGKISSLNFATSIGRVVRLDLNDAAFLPGEISLKPEWYDVLAKLIETLESEPSLLRLSYIDAGIERALAGKRLTQLRRLVSKQWNERSNRYRLEVEVRIISGNNLNAVKQSKD